MIPYLQIPGFNLGPFVLQPFGVLVAIGCIAGWLVARREARLRGLDQELIDGCLFWALVPGFLMSRLVELVFYHPATLIANPLSLLAFWESMSSFGGFFGGTIGVLTYLAFRRQPILPLGACLIVGLLVGWFFGRLGCTIVHDHPGTPSNFLLAVKFPDGPRHDLGLYEWLATIAMLVVLFSIDRVRIAPGLLVGGICLDYAPMRFMLDFLRVADLRYGGLTAAQYACIGLLVIGAWLALKALVSPRDDSAATVGARLT